ncbi:MAG: hypothetical protein WDO15_23750 [Bacteroidota bacterium]
MNAQTARIDSLLRIVAQGKKDTTTLKVIHELGIEFSRKDITKEKELVYKGLTISKQINYTKVTGFYSLLTTAHQASGDMDSSMYYLNLLEAAHKKDLNNKAIALNFFQTAGIVLQEHRTTEGSAAVHDPDYRSNNGLYDACRHDVECWETITLSWVSFNSNELFYAKPYVI